MTFQRVERLRARRQLWGGVRLLLPAFLTLLLGVLAYQLPYRGHIDIGQLGDRLWVSASEAQRAEQIERGDWYADQLGLAGRYRWSRERATITLTGLGSNALEVTFWASGWPADVVRATPKQPTIRVLVGEREVGRFTPAVERAPYTVTIPAAAVVAERLTVTLVSSATFTDTQTVVDPRPKGLRLHALDVVVAGPGTRPAWLPLGAIIAAVLTMTGLAGRLTHRAWLPPAVGLGGTLLGATLVALARIWLAALLPAWLALLLLALLLLERRRMRAAWRALRWRLALGQALAWGLLTALLAAALALLARLLLAGWPLPPIVADGRGVWLFQALVRLSLAGGLLLVLVAGVTVLPRVVLDARRALLTGRLAAILLGLAAGVWLGYQLWLIATLPFVGHADYADNAVVARNLLRGRGFVVDYVTQFYRLEPGGSVTRPQETWPLLQPLLMLPSMALLGSTPFAARLPNIVLLLVVTLLIFHIGARVWDRRVGLLAALLTLTNLLFFRLAIYATSDLALVVWSMAAFWLVGQALETPQRSTPTRWVLAGLFTGLMILQKPSAAIFAVGMGLWVLWRIWRVRGQGWRALLRYWWPRLALWVGVAFVVVLPYFVRNLQVFGRPFFSTEAYDAWVLYFRGTRAEAWEEIYRVYAPELGGPGLPDRSWILRWGWDLTLGKIAQQVRDAWDFLLPPRGELLGVNRSGIAATWLMLLGLVTLRPRQRRLIGLVGVALLLYTAFLILYWHTHDEPRYFVPFVPWLTLLAAWGACWLFDRIAALHGGRWAALGGLLLTLALGSTLQTHWRQIDAFLDPDSGDYWGRVWEGDLQAYAWLREHTPPEAVVMTRVPWQLHFHAERPAVMIPNADGATIMRVAQYYGVDYLVLGAMSTSQPERDGALVAMRRGEAAPGWTLATSVRDRFGRTIYIYRRAPEQAEERQP
ncbi:glycosyltransferase family 39 protein [Kallotenue papyrolyticum]|uniref:glycosyltransferase family 39 protein n=1 Tax=Kallotenue papyrolyticum TaxID=1325125 RepID=UPI0004785E25|nr:glycosyltransferase family 39 protein [Kallotenue papyrolyticum]